MNNDFDLRKALRDAEALAAARRFEDALSRLDELVTLFPGESSVWASRAYVFGLRSDLSRAIDQWSEAISICDLEPHYYYMRGIDLFKTGDFEKAVSDFTRVLQLCDYHKSDYYRAPAYFFRADSFVQLKEFKSAKADCQHIPENMQTWTSKLKSKADILSECG